MISVDESISDAANAIFGFVYHQQMRWQEAEEAYLAAMAGLVENLRGGATAVQLRDKGSSTRDMIELGRALLAITRLAGVPLIVNDRADVALAIDADGVHVGQEDMPAPLARRIIGRQRGGSGERHGRG